MMKLTATEAEEILVRFVKAELTTKDWYKHVENSVSAIIFYGSTAKGTNRIDSDLDLLVILPLAEEEAYTEGEYVYHFEGQEINIVLRSIERLCVLAERHDDLYQAEVFDQSQILWERDSEVSDLIKKTGVRCCHP